MRVITGSARGRRLGAPTGDAVRPTYSRVKEAMFSIVQFDIEGRRVLDLFAGSGQLGIEALSRGAGSCVFADTSKTALNAVAQNLETTGFTDRASLQNTDALRFLSTCSGVFDLVFLDPPYSAGLMEKALALLPRVLSAGACVVCETQAEAVLPDTLEGLSAKRYKYGQTALWIYRFQTPDISQM